ncbi:MAG: cytochrome b/b6 domain-containing protein [Desulfovibrio sp.]
MTTSNTKMTRVYLYTRYERFWHWLQAILIIVLLTTGFEIHGSFSWLGFKLANEIHNVAGLSWLVLFVFFVFWLFTTGQWKQYIPTTKKLFDVIRYYTSGIFKGEPHPVQKRPEAKHNPLQRLTYLALAALILPIQMLTGLMYYLYNDWKALGIDGIISLDVLAAIHTLCAFALLSFFIIHIYMTTTGHSLTAHIKAMFTGWEDVEDEDEIEDWERGQNRKVVK